MNELILFVGLCGNISIDGSLFQLRDHFLSYFILDCFLVSLLAYNYCLTIVLEACFSVQSYIITVFYCQCPQAP